MYFREGRGCRTGQTPGDGTRWTKLPVLALVVLLSVPLAVTLTAPTVRATSGVVKDMSFLLHWVNDTETAKTIHGYSVRNYFDTTLDFSDENVTVTSQTRFSVEWWLVPALAGDFRASEVTLNMWMNASGGQKSSQITVGVYDVEDASVNPDGALVGENNFGNVVLETIPTLEIFNFTFGAEQTFNASHSMRVVIELTPGTDTSVTLYWDTPTVNSRVVLVGPDSGDVASIVTLDTNRNVTVNFDPTAADKTLYIQANVTDPFGGYDIRWVNLTLLSPFDTVILDNASMTHVSGTPLSYESVFEFEWNYTNQPTGLYSVEVWALDNNGHNNYYFFQQFDFANYPDIGNSTFFIGGLPLYVNLKAVDSTGVPLLGARVALVSSGFTVDEKTTDADGMVNLTMTKGTFEFQTFWESVQVGSMIQDVQSNVSALDPLVMVTQVYYPIFQAETAGGVALPGASLLFVHPNGETLGPYKTNESGQVGLSQVPLGTYALTASWRGIDVFSGSVEVMDNSVITFGTAVYELTVTARSGAGEPLAGVFVSVTDATGLVFDAGVTGADGTAVLLLPAGSYTIQSRYVTTHMGSLYDSGVVTTSVELSSSTGIAVTFSDFPPFLTNTLVFLFGLVYAATIAALVVAFLLLRRKKAKGKAFRAGEEP